MNPSSHVNPSRICESREGAHFWDAVPSTAPAASHTFHRFSEHVCNAHSNFSRIEIETSHLDWACCGSAAGSAAAPWEENPDLGFSRPQNWGYVPTIEVVPLGVCGLCAKPSVYDSVIRP